MRMESHLIWNRKPTENMHDYAMLLCIFKAILRGWSLNCLLFPCSEPENNEPWLIDPQHSTAKKWDGPQQVSIPISFPISTMHQVLYDPTCVVRECFFPLCSRNLPNIQIRSNQSIRPEQFSINWDRPKLPLHIQKYPGISRNKEYANPHVSKNMYPIMPARNHAQNSGSHQVPNITQAQRICSLLPNLTPETTPKYLVYPIIPWHNIPQEHLLF